MRTCSILLAVARVDPSCPSHLKFIHLGAAGLAGLARRLSRFTTPSPAVSRAGESYIVPELVRVPAR